MPKKSAAAPKDTSRTQHLPTLHRKTGGMATDLLLKVRQETRFADYRLLTETALLEPDGLPGLMCVINRIIFKELPYSEKNKYEQHLQDEYHILNLK